ncbi:MAG: hypothetical protein IT179_10725 [Acidobacteria bacterium]|nr:hypothetical protein [Acidobacteriota bacterium]
MLHKRMAVTLIAAAWGLALAGLAAQQRGIGGIGITVFEDRNYRGENATFLQDTPNLGAFRLDNRISSLRIGSGEMWEACEEPNFRGRCQVFSGTEPDLGRVRWDNRISSLRRVQGGGGYPPPPTAGPSITLYRGSGYTGEQRVITSAVSDLRSFGFDNAAQSVRVNGGPWQLCEDTRFRDCRTVTSDLANLSSIGLSRRVSSARPVAGSGGGGIGVLPPPLPAVRLQLFDRTEFRGRSQTLTNDAAALGPLSGRAESLRVEGVWQICDAPNFMGQCRLVGNDETDLARVGWRDRIRSARRMQ